MSGVDRLFQLDISGCEHPHIDRDALARAQAHHLAFLQYTQQLDLNGHGQIADLVEEQGAAVGLLEPAGLGRQGAGEGAFLVAEEFGFHQRFGKGAAIDRDKGAAAARAEVVDMTRHQLLAGAGFADDQHARLAGCDLLQVRQQRRGPGVFEDLRGCADRGCQGGGGRQRQQLQRGIAHE
jgi:hypothetical protein